MIGNKPTMQEAGPPPGISVEDWAATPVAVRMLVTALQPLLTRVHTLLQEGAAGIEAKCKGRVGICSNAKRRYGPLCGRRMWSPPISEPRARYAARSYGAGAALAPSVLREASLSNES